jgi:Flp pilus assembly protein TadB
LLSCRPSSLSFRFGPGLLPGSCTSYERARRFRHDSSRKVFVGPGGSLRRTTVVAGLVAAAVTAGVAATRLALVALHVLAAAVVVPALVRHAHD